MKFFRKQTNWSTLALLSIVPFVPGLAFGSIELLPAKGHAENAKNSATNAANYCPSVPVMPDPSLKTKCEVCARGLQDAVSGLSNIEAIIGEYQAATVAGTSSVAGQQALGTATGAQKTQTVGAQGATGVGSQSNAARAQIAGKAADEFKQCLEKAQKAQCDGAPNSAAVTEVSQACTAGQNQAGKVVADNSKAGSTLGEMAGALGQAAQALGPLMQQMMQGQGAGAGSSNPYGSTVSKPAPLASAKLSASNPAAGGSVGFGSGASTGVDGSSAASGYAPAYQARSFEAEPTLASSLGGSDPGSTGGASSGGVSTTGASSMGGAGNFGSKDSSGASKMGEKNAGIMDPNNFEMPSGGSSGGRPFLGLKSKSLSMDDGSSGTDTSSSFASELGLDEEGRDLASTDQLGSDIHGEESGTLFDAIRSKYSEIKKRGNI